MSDTEYGPKWGPEGPPPDMAKTDAEIDEIVRELVEWMDGWGWRKRKGIDAIDFDEPIKVGGVKIRQVEWVVLRESLDLVREIEVAVEENGFYPDYMNNRSKILRRNTQEYPDNSDVIIDLQGPITRLRALYRTLREAEEI